MCVTGLRPGRPGLPRKPGDPGGRAFQPQDIATAAWARNCSPERPPCTPPHPKAKDGAPPCSHLGRSAGHCGPREASAAAGIPRSPATRLQPNVPRSSVCLHSAAAHRNPPAAQRDPLWDRSPSGTGAACPAQERDGLPSPLWTHSLCRVKLHSKLTQ